MTVDPETSFFSWFIILKGFFENLAWVFIAKVWGNFFRGQNPRWPPNVRFEYKVQVFRSIISKSSRPIFMNFDKDICLGLRKNPGFFWKDRSKYYLQNRPKTGKKIWKSLLIWANSPSFAIYVFSFMLSRPRKSKMIKLKVY